MRDEGSYLDRCNGFFVYIRKKLVETELILKEQEKLLQKLRAERESLKKQTMQLMAGNTGGAAEV